MMRIKRFLLLTSLFLSQEISAKSMDSAFSRATIRVIIEPQLVHGKKISDDIYGLGTYMREKHSQENVWDLRPSSIRFGGNTSERYNWKTNSWNTGKDWYFRNFESKTPNMIDALIAQNNQRNVSTRVTIPLLDWVARDSRSGSFPAILFPDQADIRDGFGTGKLKSGKLESSSPNLANIRIDENYIKDWVLHLSSKFGSAPHHYIIGNEPLLWHETHRDVQPVPATFENIIAAFIARAKIIRAADPDAIIFGPSLWGYHAVRQSARERSREIENFDISLLPKDKLDIPFLELFLSEIHREEQKTGIRLLDVVDVHHYPENTIVRKMGPQDDFSRKARIESTRSLWDPEYRDDSWIKDRIFLIPRLRKLLDSINPRLKLAIGEYNFYAEEDSSGGLAVAEALGIFGREGLDFASYWTIPRVHSPASFAFRLFRNYDGKGAQFGDISLKNSLGSSRDASVFSSFRSSDRKIISIFLNKSVQSPTDFEISVSSLPTPQEAKLYLYTSESRGISLSKVRAEKNGAFKINLPPQSMAVIQMDSMPE